MVGKKYETVIGLEVHVQLKTFTKIFCSCPVGWGGEPNTRVCPVCLGLPGVLPVLNEKAVELAVRAGLALGSRISTFSKFDRKNYFYPDLPKAYQISQYDKPLNVGGEVEVRVEGKKKSIRLTRAHLEEDAGKLTHFEKEGFSGVDYNRTGVPLLEIVSEPDLRSPQEAYEYLKALRSLIRYTGVSDCDMEKGSFRCDANISLRPIGTRKLGVKAEVKNLNSFRGVERALSYEIERQLRLLKEGKKILQETRLYDADSRKTFSMRSKEEAHDYRYFPDPDLVPVVVDKEWVEEIRGSLPEMPVHRTDRFQSQYGLPSHDAAVLTSEKPLADYFEEAARFTPSSKLLSNWVRGNLLGKLNEEGLTINKSPISPERLAGLIELINRATISGNIAKAVFARMFSDRRSAGEIVEEQKLIQISDEGELKQIVEDIIAAHPGPVADYRGGKRNALSFLVGQVMKATRGQANPSLANRLLRDRLNPPV